MASYSQATPLLPLHISDSPLISDALSGQFFSTLETQGISSPLPMPSLPFAPSSPTYATVSSRPAGLFLNDEPEATPEKDSLGNTDTAHNKSYSKPLPDLPLAVLQISTKQIISLLDLLEEMDDDVMKEVQRVQEGIREAHAEIEEYRREQKTRRVDSKRQERRQRA